MQQVRHRIDVEERQLSKLCLKKTGLMQDLLTGKVRVNVDEDANDV